MTIETRFVHSPDGARIAYDVCGKGPAVMLLHGAGKTRIDWHKLGCVDRLKETFTVITVDIRGSGESDFLTTVSDYKIDKILADLYAAADACDVQRFAVWGFSFGGNIARYLGAWSDRVSAIAVIGVPFGPAVDAAFDHFIDGFLEKYGPLVLGFNEGRISEEERKEAVKGRIPVWAACFQAMRSWPVIEPADVSCPSLLLYGTKNENVMAWAESNQKALINAGTQVEVVGGLTHHQEFSEIDLVYPAVSSFLNSGSRP